jgi:hypothetical protein
MNPKNNYRASDFDNENKSRKERLRRQSVNSAAANPVLIC